MVRVFATQVCGDTILVYEMTNGEAGWGAAVRLAPDGALRWSYEIPGFNIGHPLVEGDRLYLSAFGFLAGLSLKSGRTVWLHENLYESDTNSFVGFDVPIVGMDLIYYREIYKSEPRALRTYAVDRLTGNLSEP
ncbi:MAG: hypothetical protein R3F35_16240 [Myxococcota bacterium]